MGDSDNLSAEVERRRQRDPDFDRYLGQLANIGRQIESRIESGTSLDPYHSIGNAFEAGAHFGTFVAERVHQSAVSYQDILRTLPNPLVYGSSNRKENRRNASLPYLENGIRGQELFIDERSLYFLRSLEESAVSDETKREFFRLGFGLILFTADAAHRIKLGMDPNPLDWDQGLRNLLDNDD